MSTEPDPEGQEAIAAGFMAMKQTRTMAVMLWIGDHGWNGAWLVTASPTEGDPDAHGRRPYFVAAERYGVAALVPTYVHSQN